MADKPNMDGAGHKADHQGADHQANQMWGGRFSLAPSEIMEQINASIDFDQRLYREDIQGSKAHCEMLQAVGILTRSEAGQILAGLEQIEAEIAKGEFRFSRALEDIHMNIEARLREIIGPVAGKLHAARSRSEQVALDFRLFIRAYADRLCEQIPALMKALVHQAQLHADLVMPGFTHLQSAQPVTFGHHCLAYVEMFARDLDRMRDARRRLNECPLGAAALAGTSFQIDRELTARALGFEQPTRNSLDSVSDRDFALELLSVASLTAVHLSRLAEEIVIWCSAQFAFIKLSDRFTTGSSIMPQKRNPDAAELVRAKTGRIFAGLQGLLTVMKGLPLAYSKDMQEDKEYIFDALDALNLMLAAMTGMVEDLQPDRQNMERAAGQGYSTATDLADWLVRVLNMPFRDAHHVTGLVVAAAENRGVALDELSLDELQQIEPRITNDVFSVLSVRASVESRTSYGGTAPANVRKMAQFWDNQLNSATFTLTANSQPD